MSTTHTTKPRSEAWSWTAFYGPASRSFGILGDHLAAAGLEAHVIADGRQIVAIDGKIVQVLCSEVIPISTEDGPATGRCGKALRGDVYACPGHTYERESWLAMSEEDKAMWELRQEQF